MLTHAHTNTITNTNTVTNTRSPVKQRQTEDRERERDTKTERGEGEGGDGEMQWGRGNKTEIPKYTALPYNRPSMASSSASHGVFPKQRWSFPKKKRARY